MGSCRAVVFLIVVSAAGLQAQQDAALPDDLRVALQALPLQAPAVGGAVVTVVDADGKPLAGADVFVFDPQVMRAHETALRDLQTSVADPERQLLARLYWSSRRLLTGADGSVCVGDAAMGASALHGDQLGFSRRAERGEPVVITVLPVLDCVGRAVDDKGRPVAGIELGFAAGREGDLRDAPFQPIARTGADGSLRFRLPQSLLAMLPEGAAARLRAGVVGALVSAPLEVAAEGRTATATLRLPPTGQVRVIVYDAAEKPLAGVRDVQLQTVAEVQRRRGGRPGSGNRSGIGPARTDAEGALFGWVALDQDLVATAAVDGVAGTLKAEGAGPSRGGELVVLDLRTVVAAPQLRGVVRGLDGEPVAGETLIVALVGARASRSLLLETAADGSFALQLPAEFALDDGARAFVMRHGPRNGPTVYGGAVVVPIAAGSRGPIDCGTLQLVEEPVLVQGTVVDSEGKPIAGVELEAPLSHCAAANGRGSSSPSDHRVRSGAGGRFVLRELQPAPGLPKLWLPMLSTQQIVEQQPSGADPRDLRVVVSGSGSLLLCAPDAPSNGVRVMLRNEAEPKASYPFQQRAGGQRLYLRLPPGTYDVLLEVDGQVVWRVDGIPVRAGELCEDARVMAIPWRDHVDVHKLTVRDARGRPVVADIAIRRAHGRSSSLANGRVERDGTMLVAVPKGNPGALAVSHAEYLTQRFPSLDRDLDVTMLPRPRLLLVLPQGLQLPAGTVVRLHDPVASGFQGERGSLEVQAGAALLLRPEQLGRMTVTLGGKNLPRDGAVWSGEIEVKSGDEVQQVELPIDDAVIAALRELLRSERGR